VEKIPLLSRRISVRVIPSTFQLHCCNDKHKEDILSRNKNLSQFSVGICSIFCELSIEITREGGNRGGKEWDKMGKAGKRMGGGGGKEEVR
jgi:hypothetical protein